jgi:hypothetical protein
MIMDAVGSIPKVVGRRSEMVATGPIPGKTPIKVPTRQPIKQNKRLFKLKAILKPRVKLSRTSID